MSRAVMQQALEALEWNYNTDLDNIAACEQWAKMLKETITNLRAALAEPEQEPVASLMTNIKLGDQKVVWNDDGFDRALWHETPLYAAPTPHKPQTTHWEGCEAVHPECKTEHGVKNLDDYEFKTYKTGGAELEAGFYSTDELRDLVKALDKMNAATERSMRRMK